MFRQGNRVRCYNASGTLLHNGKVYIVSDMQDGKPDYLIALIGVVGWFSNTRFDFVSRD